MMGSGCLALIYPMPHKKAYVYGHLVITPEESDPLTADPLGSFAQIFSSFGGLMPAIIEDLQKTSPHFYVHHMEKSHSMRFTSESKRVLFAGDAAHGFGPMLQNGAAQAFEDACVIQDLLRNTAIDKLAEAFEIRRLERISMIFEMSNQKIRTISDPAQVEALKNHIRIHGAPNVNAFKQIMGKNP